MYSLSGRSTDCTGQCETVQSVSYKVTCPVVRIYTTFYAISHEPNPCLPSRSDTLIIALPLHFRQRPRPSASARGGSS